MSPNGFFSQVLGFNPSLGICHNLAVKAVNGLGRITGGEPIEALVKPKPPVAALDIYTQATKSGVRWPGVLPLADAAINFARPHFAFGLDRAYEIWKRPGKRIPVLGTTFKLGLVPFEGLYHRARTFYHLGRVASWKQRATIVVLSGAALLASLVGTKEAFDYSMNHPGMCGVCHGEDQDSGAHPWANDQFNNSPHGYANTGFSTSLGESQYGVYGTQAPPGEALIPVLTSEGLGLVAMQDGVEELIIRQGLQATDTVLYLTEERSK